MLAQHDGVEQALDGIFLAEGVFLEAQLFEAGLWVGDEGQQIIVDSGEFVVGQVQQADLVAEAFYEEVQAAVGYAVS